MFRFGLPRENMGSESINGSTKLEMGERSCPRLSEAAVRAVLQRNLEFAEQAFALLGAASLALDCL